MRSPAADAGCGFAGRGGASVGVQAMGGRNAVRRTLMSCISPRRYALSAAALISSVTSRPAAAQAGFDLERLMGAVGQLDRQELAALALAAAILGFSVVAAILLMRTRTRAADNELRLRSEIQALQTSNDRSEALLSFEPQAVISWRAGEDIPQIAGDTSMLVEGSRNRILAFGNWLAPEPSLRLERAVDALRNDAESFALNLTTTTGRAVEAVGRVVGGQAIVRIRELSGLRRDLADMTLRYNTLMEETEILRGFATAIPAPVWARRANGTLSFANPAYAIATEASSSADAVKRNLDLLDSTDRTEMARVLSEQSAFAKRLPLVVRGERRFFDIQAIALRSGSAGIAIDASEAASLRASLSRMADAHRRTLDQLSSAVAVFDDKQRLTFYNESYRRLWDLDVAFLDAGPSDSAILDQLRAERKIPEQQDFRQWKTRLHEAYRSTEAKSEEWHLPDGRTLRVIATPNPEGGVTYLFDDATESLDLSRQFDALIRVQRATLDNLAEAVAVFGSNGRARLFNPAFAKMWRLSPEALEQQPHIRTVQEWCAPLFDDERVWQELRGAITGIDDRNSVVMQIELKDGSVLNCMTMPLPDGATLLTFQDVTDTVNVERVLRERNEALEAADRMKINFVHHVSYELRSPLTTIIGFAHFLSDPSTGPLTLKQSEYLAYITSSTNALLAIINNILDLATIDAGAMSLNLGPVDVRKAIEQATAGVQDRLDDIKLDVNVAEPSALFMADERRVVQVLYNLLANAIGFSPPGGTVAVTATQHDNRTIFLVSDQGPGIPPESQDKVFDWFEANANGSRHRGAGLGLSLVRSFVEMHGGRVSIDSAVGRGTTVTVEFPAEPPARGTGE
jgi:signal transduction histidine kinase